MNVGTAGRAIRVILRIALPAVVVWGAGWTRWLVLIGIVPLTTGLIVAVLLMRCSA
jgi:hypothetical protein